METVTINVRVFSDYPNDMELGNKVRELYQRQLEESNGKEISTK